jgi:hypothetical protein
MNFRLNMIHGVLLLLLSSGGLADDGRIYGTVTTDDDVSITGAIRWNDEEVFWTDHFNGDKASATDLSGLNDEEQELILDRQPGPQLDLNGTTIELIKWFSSDTLDPQDFYLEFGSISIIEPLGGDQVKVTLRDGSEIEGDGGSNDIGADIVVRSEDGTVQEIDWDDVKTVVFSASGEDAPSFGEHLYGRVKTESGEFQGLVQWDHDERVGSEKLDGDVDDNDISIDFGNIISITKEKDGSRVITRDGANLFMVGSNDVNDENRGIYVDDPRSGRIDISWELFISVEFITELERPLTTYADFAKVGRLRGTVALQDDKSASGSLTYDVDEWTSAEMISGRTEAGLRYMIPLRLVSSITRKDENSAQVKLTSGDEITLQGERDINHKNNGIIINMENEGAMYVDWKTVKSVSFSDGQ